MKPAERVYSLLIDSGKTLSCAESCTGGNVAHQLTMIPGASKYFLGGVVSYDVRVKESILGVPAELIADRGVVSSEVAAAMAEGIRSATGSDYSVATTGVAGPGGECGLEEGTVWIGVAGPKGTETYLFKTGSAVCGAADADRRYTNIKAFTSKALDYLADYIEK